MTESIMIKINVVRMRRIKMKKTKKIKAIVEDIHELV